MARAWSMVNDKNRMEFEIFISFEEFYFSLREIFVLEICE